MPGVNITPQEAEAAMERGSSDLKFLLAREDVGAELQAKLFHVGITTVAKFSTIADTAAELKTMLKDDFGLDSAADLQSRVLVASILVAFQAARVRTEKFAEVEGDLNAKRLQKPLATSDYQAMRKSWETKWWPLEDNQAPGRSYMEKRADELESGDFRAEPLTVVLSRDEDQTDCFTSFWDSAGQLQLKKGGTTVAEPHNSEALRRRIKLMGVSLMWLGIRHTNRGYLQGISPQLFEDYLSYLLGDFVWQLTGKAADGSTVMTPAWSQLLVYEFSIRKQAYHLMANGEGTFSECLKTAMRDPTTKERFFTTPVALSASLKRPLAFNDDGAGKRSKNKGRSKGQGKGKPSGGGKGDGKQGKNKGGKGRSGPCYAYNNHWERCRNTNCKFAHVCSKCGGKHPVYQCSNGQAPAQETQGGVEGNH